MLCCLLGAWRGGLIAQGDEAPVSMVDLLPRVAAPELRSCLPNSARTSSIKARTRAESAELRARVIAAAQGKERHRSIAKREGVSEGYVDAIVVHAGVGRIRRTQEQVDALVDRAEEIMQANPEITQQDIAGVVGISPAYLCSILSRRKALKRRRA